MYDLCVVQHEYGVRQRGGIRGLLRRERHPYDLLPRTRRQVEALGYVAPSSHSHPFDTALRAYSGQAVDLQEATSEPGVRVAKYRLVINQWHQPLSPPGELSACPHRQVDSPLRSCRGLREKAPFEFLLVVTSVEQTEPQAESVAGAKSGRSKLNSR